MDEIILNENDVRIKAILDRMNPFIQNGEDLAALGFAYGTSSTAGGTATKEVTISNFILTPGAIISVLFSNAFTATSPKLKVNTNTAYDMKLYGSALAPGKVHANTVVTMQFTGSEFNVIAILSQQAQSTQGAIDLALPSGLLWCEHNVGASRPEEVGLYFSWGNITGHAEGSGYDFSQANYETTDGYSLAADISVGDQYDMAHHNMGGQWRLPRKTEFQELYDNCDSEWIAQDGMNGRRFTSRANGNSIFFPAAGFYDGTTLYRRGSSGYYWSSSFYSATNAYNLSFYSAGVSPQGDSYRRYGFTVRAVQ